MAKINCVTISHIIRNIKKELHIITIALLKS